MQSSVVLFRRAGKHVEDLGVIDVPFHPAIHERIVSAWTTHASAQEEAGGFQGLVVTVSPEVHLAVRREGVGASAGAQ